MGAVFVPTLSRSGEYANLARAQFVYVEPSKKHDGKFVALGVFAAKTVPLALFDDRSSAEQYVGDLCLRVNEAAR